MLSATNRPVINYRVYYLKKHEIIIWGLVAFTVGAIVGYVFYGGIGLDQNGYPTNRTYIMNTIVMSLCGLIAVKIFLPIRKRQIMNKRTKTE